jgi:hypothetical protein
MEKFSELAKQINDAVFTVVRVRKEGVGYRWTTLGSGFFVSPNGYFLTCHHVINSPKNQHIDGDGYRILSRTGGSLGKFARWHQILNVTAGKELTLIPDKDIAIIKFPLGLEDKQVHLNINYSPVDDGTSIGVMGYPLSRLMFKNNNVNEPDLSNIFPRLSRNIISSQQEVELLQTPDGNVSNIILVEVNFLFVPGNSGGPIFSADNGDAIAFVAGYRAFNLGNNINAIYSHGISFKPLKSLIKSIIG